MGRSKPKPLCLVTANVSGPCSVCRATVDPEHLYAPESGEDAPSAIYCPSCCQGCQGNPTRMG